VEALLDAKKCYIVGTGLVKTFCYFASICAIAKDEPDIIDWVNYHFAIGFDKIWIFDNPLCQGSCRLIPLCQRNGRLSRITSGHLSNPYAQKRTAWIRSPLFSPRTGMGPASIANPAILQRKSRKF
jgi:hypothetical protein